MQSHYEITTTIRYYKPSCAVALLPGPHPRLRVTLEGKGTPAFDVSRWKDPPHVALANLLDDPKAVLQFTRTYGVLSWDKRKTVPVREVLDNRDFLRCAWEGDAYNLFALPPTKDIWLITQPARGIELAVSALWPLIHVLFARDWAEKRIRKCANPDCAVPYFRAVRRGQKFCSQKCAVLINVHHFREREAARKAKGESRAKAKKA